MKLAPFFGEGNGTPLQYSCLENPMDGGAWRAAVHGVAKSRTQLSDFPFTFHFHAFEKEMATHSSVLAWRIPGTGEPGGLPSMGSHSQTQLKWLSSSSSSTFFSHTNDQKSSHWATENSSKITFKIQMKKATITPPKKKKNTNESMNIKSKLFSGILHNHITQNLHLELSFSYLIFLW